MIGLAQNAGNRAIRVGETDTTVLDILDQVKCPDWRNRVLRYNFAKCANELVLVSYTDLLTILSARFFAP